MIYGKMNIPEMYFFHAMLVLVTRKAVVPPKIMANTQVQKARRRVFQRGIQRFVLASLEVKRSM